MVFSQRQEVLQDLWVVFPFIMWEHPWVEPRLPENRGSPRISLKSSARAVASRFRGRAASSAGERLALGGRDLRRPTSEAGGFPRFSWGEPPVSRGGLPCVTLERATPLYVHYWGEGEPPVFGVFPCFWDPKAPTSELPTGRLVVGWAAHMGCLPGIHPCYTMLHLKHL